MSEGIRIAVDFGSMPKTIRSVDAQHLVNHAAVDAVNVAGPFVARSLAKNTPVGATGKARQSVNFEPARAHGFGSVTGFVGYGAPASLYIGFANDGTRPHRPPITPLIYWAARVLGDAGAGPRVARFIQMYGTKAQHFVEDTRDEVEPKAVAMMHDQFVRFFEEL